MTKAEAKSRRSTLTPTFNIAAGGSFLRQRLKPPAVDEKTVSFYARVVALLTRVLMAVLQALIIVPARFVGYLLQQYTSKVSRRRQLHRLRAILGATEDHGTWDETAKQLDELQGYDEWKVKNTELTRQFCQADLLQAETRIVAMLFRARHDPSVASYLTTALKRDLYGITQDPLYRYYRGTKVFVQEYVSTITQLIDGFAEGDYRTAQERQRQRDAESLRNRRRTGGPLPPFQPPSASLRPLATSLQSAASAGPLAPSPMAAMVSPGMSPTPSAGLLTGLPPVPHTTNGTTNHGRFPSPDSIAIGPSTAAPEDEEDDFEPPQPRPIEKADIVAIACDRERSLPPTVAPQLQALVRHAQINGRLDGIGCADSESDRGHSPTSPFIGIAGPAFTLEDRIQVLSTAAQSFGRSALLLSGGAALGMYHSGVVRALYNEGLMPKIVCGSSAGAIIASIFCTRKDEEVAELCQGNTAAFLKGISLEAFEVHEDVLGTQTLMNVKKLMRCLEANCGNVTFLEAYERTGRVLNVSIAAFQRDGDKSMLLNYVTAPNVLVWSGVAASCAFSGLFSAVQLMQRLPNGEIDRFLPGQLWFDGSVPCDLPKRRLAELFNVNYFIVSQVNPHVVPFLPKPPSHMVNKPKQGLLRQWWGFACSESKYWLVKLYRFGLLPTSGGWELPYMLCNQQYTGDVTIRPLGSIVRAIPDFINLTTNPTTEHMEYVTSNSQRQTWPALIQIQYATEVERCLDNAIARLKNELRVQRESCSC